MDHRPTSNRFLSESSHTTTSTHDTKHHSSQYSPVDDPSPYPPSSHRTPVLPERKPVTKKTRWTPVMIKTWILFTVAAIMIAVAVGIEVAFALTFKSQGFSVERLDDFGSVQFLDSFFPVLLSLPLVIYWARVNHEVMRLQPYIDASHGDQPATRTVLLDYVNSARSKSLMKAYKNSHYLVLFSSLLYLLTNFFQPLAAALFAVRQTEHNKPSEVSVSVDLGIRDDFLDLNAFVAAAGYAEAAVVHGLGDPPFVRDGWALATFEPPEQPKNGSVIVENLPAVRTDPRCEILLPPDQLQLTLNPNTSYTIRGTKGSCVAQVDVNPEESTEHFGVVRVDGCGFGGESSAVAEQFRPITFWFFTFGDEGSDEPVASMIFCSPVVQTFAVQASISLSTHELSDVLIMEELEATSNVTAGPPLNGLALNGFFFPPPPNNNRFISARATTLLNAIPGAIFRDAKSQGRPLSMVLRDTQRFRDMANGIYTQYLAISAKSNFFLDQRKFFPATLKIWSPRVWMDQYASHGLAGLLTFIAIFMIIVQMIHRRERTRLYLAGPVGSIASDVSLTSSARFGILLNAGDTEKDMKEKLKGMRFGIEKETGQIIVEREIGPSKFLSLAGDKHSTHKDEEFDPVTQGLLGGKPHRDSAVGLVDRTSLQPHALGSDHRLSIVGSLASPPPSRAGATFQTAYRPNTGSAPSPLASPAITSTYIGSSTPQNVQYTAPSNPPPQTVAYHDPFAR